MLLFFSLRPFPRYRMPVIFFAWHSWHFWHFSPQLCQLCQKCHVNFCVGKSGISGKSFAISAISASAFFHHFIDRLDKNVSYSLYISYSFLIHYRSVLESTSVQSRSHCGLTGGFFIRSFLFDTCVQQKQQPLSELLLIGKSFRENVNLSLSCQTNIHAILYWSITRSVACRSAAISVTSYLLYGTPITLYIRHATCEADNSPERTRFPPTNQLPHAKDAYYILLSCSA